MLEEEAIMWDLFDEGLVDDDLPLAKMQVQGRSNICNVLVSRRGKEFRSFCRSKKSMAADNFLDKQWLVLAPVFSTIGAHFRIEEDAPLPFYDVERASPISRSTVYKALLHPAHQSPKADRPLQIAIKGYTEEEDFNKEKINLIAIRGLEHPHLIRHIATIQHGSFFYAIFPWADGGNLSDFWKRDPNVLRTRHATIFMWSFRQMLGLVSGLFALHRMNCRHGDLKPENILHFRAPDDLTVHQNEHGTLVIADVGVSRVHDQATGLRKNATNTKATTRCYEAPEAESNTKAPRGRRYDMWSLGCIFMEFTIWLLYGNKAITDFRSRRSSAAYYETTTGNPLIDPAVTCGLDALKNDPRCSQGTGLADLINLIADDLIVIEPENRVKAEELRDKFEKMVQRAEEGPDYLVRGIEAPYRVPDAFTIWGDDNGYG